MYAMGEYFLQGLWQAFIHAMSYRNLCNAHQASLYYYAIQNCRTIITRLLKWKFFFLYLLYLQNRDGKKYDVYKSWTV